MNLLETAKRAQVVSCLVEGCSIRSTVRMTGAAKNTVTKLLVDLGAACDAYQNRIMRNLPCKRLEVDEIWSFVYAKQKNVPPDLQGVFGYGDVWTWTCIDAETKLMPTWLVASRSPQAAHLFIQDIADRLANRVQLTSDGLRYYVDAVYGAFHDNIDYAMLVKTFGSPTESTPTAAKYSPSKINGTQRTPLIGVPDPDLISTSYAERANLTMRMKMRRFTRLTNAFSKKVENLNNAVCLHFMHYNFVRKHQTLKTTPAVAAGVADHVWTMEEMVGLLATERQSN